MPIILLHFAHSYLLKRFWLWWRQQLLALTPDRLLTLLPQQNRVFIAMPDEETLLIYRQDLDQNPASATRIPLKEFRQWYEKAEFPTETAVILLLYPAQYLHRRITLPAAARENLAQVIGFELDRHTPFNVQQVYFSACIAEHLSQNAQISVDVVVTPKAVLDDLLALLHGAGIHPQQVTILAPPDTVPQMDFDLLPPQQRPRSFHWQKKLNLALASLLLILVALAMALPVFQQHQTIHSLEVAIKKARLAASKANQLKQEVQILAKQSRFVLDKKQATPPLIAIMDELSLRLPADTWLTGFQYRDGQLKIDGKSPAASKLVELLEDSPYLQNVHFVSPVTQDRTSGLERFRISIDITHEAQPNPTD